MQIYDTSQLDPSGRGLSSDEVYWLYNALDCCLTSELRETLGALMDPVARATYDRAMTLQAPLLEMMLRGIKVDARHVQQKIAECESNLASLEESFNLLCLEGLGLSASINWRSPTQLKQFFYNFLGFKEIRKRNTHGVMSATVGREALEKLSINFVATPFCNFILKMRDIGKMLGFLRTKRDADGRFRCNFNIAGTNTGRLSSSFSDFGTGCVLPEAEALTPSGWKRMDKIRPSDLIAQYDNGEISFVPQTMYSRDYSGPLYNLSGEQFNLSITPGHRMLWRNYHNPEYRTTSAHDTAFARQIYLPLAGEYVGGSISVPPYLAMLMADFSREPTQWRGSFKKKRKSERFLQLAETHNLEFSEQRAKPGYRRFALRGHTYLPTEFGPWVLSLTPESAEELIKETAFWDAHVRGKSFIFYSAKPDAAEWFQTLCHLTGRSATLRRTVNSDLAYGSNSVIYSVNVKPKAEAQILEKHWGTYDYEGKIYCPQVASSYWLVRDNGFISVTGNTNLQNVDRNLRYIFIPDPGRIFFNVDLEQGDSRGVGALAWNMFHDADAKQIAEALHLPEWTGPVGREFAGSYLDACESGDLHTTVCRMAWPELSWGEDPDGWRDVAEGIAYRTYTYRDLAKKLGHGCLTSDHEVLTPDGWVPISSQPKTIMEWDEKGSRFTGTSHWEAKPYTGELQLFEGNSMSALMTHDHRVPYKADQRSNGIKERPANLGPQCFMPLGSGWEGGTEVVPAKLIAAFMCDGHQETNWMAFHMTKQRKIDRLVALCEEYGYEYKYQGADKIRVKGRLPKRPGASMFRWTEDCLRDFVLELRYWDGHVSATSVSISCKHRDDLEWYQTFGRICGIGGAIQKPQTSGFGTTIFRLQQNSRQYANGSSVVHTRLPVKDVMVYCPKVSSGWFYVRRKGKIFVTGNTNYLGQPRTMAAHSKVPEPQIVDFQRKYLSVSGAFPCITAWQNVTIANLKSTNQLTHLLGRRRWFYGRTEEQSVQNAAIAYCPQGMTGDLINEGLVNCWRDPQYELMIQVHDSVLGQFDAERIEELAPRALELLSVSTTLAGGREFSIPCEIKLGYNWGDASATNLSGMKKFKGSETRVRPRYLPPRRAKAQSFSTLLSSK